MTFLTHIEVAAIERVYHSQYTSHNHTEIKVSFQGKVAWRVSNRTYNPPNRKIPVI